MDLTMDWLDNMLYYSYFEATSVYVKLTKPAGSWSGPTLYVLDWIDQGQFPQALAEDEWVQEGVCFT